MKVETETHQVRTDASEGDLCVWWRRGDDMMRFYPVANPAEAKSWLGRLSQRDLKDERCPWNAGGLEVFEDGAWSEWSDDEGNDIDEHEITA